MSTDSFSGGGGGSAGSHHLPLSAQNSLTRSVDSSVEISPPSQLMEERSIRSVQSTGKAKKVGKITKLRRKLGLSKKSFLFNGSGNGNGSGSSGKKPTSTSAGMTARSSSAQEEDDRMDEDMVLDSDTISSGAADNERTQRNVMDRSRGNDDDMDMEETIEEEQAGNSRRRQVSFQRQHHNNSGIAALASSSSSASLPSPSVGHDHGDEHQPDHHYHHHHHHRKLSVETNKNHLAAPQRSPSSSIKDDISPTPKTITVHQSHIGMIQNRRKDSRVRTVSSSQVPDHSTTFNVSTQLLSPEALPNLLSSPGRTTTTFAPVPLSHAKTMDVTGSYPSLLKKTFGKRLPFGISNSSSAVNEQRIKGNNDLHAAASASAPSLLIPLSGKRSKTIEPKSASAKSPSTSFEHIPLQHFDTIEPAGGFKASLAWRMNKKKEEQEHITIHAFDKTGKNLWNRLTSMQGGSGESSSAAGIAAFRGGQDLPEQQNSLLSMWPEEIVQARAPTLTGSASSPSSAALDSRSPPVELPTIVETSPDISLPIRRLSEGHVFFGRKHSN